ncbi:MAG: hypothetical protein JXB46_01840 [Candidatus Eisenbacteria bacterium]|nr:hypothetical protein [Candidatus Eisenbacteria bacterium]
MSGSRWSSRVLLLLLAMVLLWVYCYGISSNPLTWEEPRRCLVASEMIHRGDYIVPRLLGEVYVSKPPLQSWLVVLFSGNRADLVGALPLRSVSVLSLIGISLLLFVLARPGRTVLSAWLPALIFLTMGITVQYGRSGEMDALFTLWVTAALSCFEIGRRVRSPWLQWFAPQALLAGGILTKVLAPLFFYPPVLYRTLRECSKASFPVRAFAVGLLTAGVLVSAWLVPFALRSRTGLLGDTLWRQLLRRTPAVRGAWDSVTNLFSFPVEVLGNLLPWSLLLLLWLMPGMRREMRERYRTDPLHRLSVAVSVWTFLILWLMPGAKGRYMMPAYPFLAILLAHTVEASGRVLAGARQTGLLPRLRRWLRAAFVEGWVGWAAAAAVWTAGMLHVGAMPDSPSTWQPLCVGLIAVAAIAAWVRVGKTRTLPAAGLLLLGLLYAISYSGVTAAHLALRNARYVSVSERIASFVDKPEPVICTDDVPRTVCYYVGHLLGRPLEIASPHNGAYYLIGSNEIGSTGGSARAGRKVGSADWLHVWEVTVEAGPSCGAPPDHGQ